MAAAMNAIGYDAAALGNHEFNYGIPYLRTFEKQLDFPLLAANATNDKTGAPAFTPYIIKTVRRPNGKPVKVGILGLTNPGIAIWDKANVEGQMSFGGLVEQAAKYVPEMKRKGADVVVVSAHSGADTSSSYGDALPFPENAATLVAEQVPGHRRDPRGPRPPGDRRARGHQHRHRQARRPVRAPEVGQRLSVFDIDLSFSRGHWTVQSVDVVGAQLEHRAGGPEDRRLLADEQKTVVDYVNGVIGTSTEAMSAATARYEDTAVLDFINYVQAGAVKADAHRRRRRPARAVDRGTVQQGRRDPAG